MLVDRGENWEELRRARETIARAARRQMDRGRKQATESLTSLLQEPQ